MVVYLLYIDNGEAYEDYQENVAGVFSTKEKAEQKLKDIGYIPVKMWDGKDGWAKEIGNEWWDCTSHGWIEKRQVH